MWNSVYLQVEWHYEQIKSKPNKAPDWILQTRQEKKNIKVHKHVQAHALTFHNFDEAKVLLKHK